MKKDHAHKLVQTSYAVGRINSIHSQSDGYRHIKEGWKSYRLFGTVQHIKGKKGFSLPLSMLDYTDTLVLLCGELEIYQPSRGRRSINEGEAILIGRNRSSYLMPETDCTLYCFNDED